MILVLDTCTERLLVGVRDAGEDHWTNIDSRAAEGPANHGRDLLPALAELVGERVPEAVGVALGPGSFTGVRIGLATAKGLAAGWKVPLVGLDNLAAMAQTWANLSTDDAAVLPAIDARKGKFYGALYHQRRVLLQPADQSPEAWWQAVTTVWSGPVVVSGYQGRALADRFPSPLPEGWRVFETLDWTPALLDQAADLWTSGVVLGPKATPRYLRLSEAEEVRALKGKL